MIEGVDNILLFISDQHRSDLWGVHPDHVGMTPNLENLWKNGTVFPEAITPCPLCTPARAALFSGMYPHQIKGREESGKSTSMAGNHSSLEESPMLTNRLRNAGFHTFYAGKWHLGNEIITDWFEDARAFDSAEYIAECERSGKPLGHTFSDKSLCTHRTPAMSIPKVARGDYSVEQSFDGWIANHAVEALRERPKGKPFFGVCSFEGPHPPFKIPEPFFSRYNPERMEAPPNFGPQDSEPGHLRDSFYRTLFKDHGEDWESWQASAAVYRGFISMIDSLIGEVVDEVKRQNLLDRTLIIYCSDHGEMLGSHGLWHKMAPYEESVRVPLLFSHPNLPGGGLGKDSRSCSLIDLAPTILGSVGLEGADHEGADLLKASPSPSQNRDQFSAQDPLGSWHGIESWRMIVREKKKLVLYEGGEREWFDLREDPFERKNLIAEASGSDWQPMQDALQAWMERTGSTFS